MQFVDSVSFFGLETIYLQERLVYLFDFQKRDIEQIIWHLGQIWCDKFSTVEAAQCDHFGPDQKW